MADIRINALATTAASTASDDFIAVDGSANGTRKLNAYSPTFGGNLTVSGSGTVNSPSGTSSGLLVKAFNTAGGNVQQWADFQTSAGLTLARFLRGNGASGYDANGLSIDSYSGLWVNLNALGGSGGAFTIAGGNLTVSGTATTSGKLTVSTTAGQEGMLVTGVSGEWTGRFQANTTSGSSYGLLIRGGTNTSDKALSVYNAGGTTELVQVRGDGLTTLAGNLTVSGLGDFQKSLTNIATESDYALRVKTAANDGGLYFGANSGISVIQAIAPGSTFDRKLSIQPNGGNVLIGTAADGGQKLQVAGDAIIGVQSGGTSSTLSLNTGGSNRATITADASYLTINSITSNPMRLQTNGTTALTLDSSQNATFAGSIAIGNTVQTAVSVASTHKVTISIGGSTYYLLATNV